MLKKSITKQNRLWWILALSALFLATLTTLRQWQVPLIEEAVVQLGKHSKNVELPYKESSSTNVKSFSVNLSLLYEEETSFDVLIVPDDCMKQIEVNGKKVDLSGINRRALCDYRNGFRLNLSPYLQAGENNISFLMNDHGGSRAFSIKRISALPIGKVLWTLWGLWAVFAVYFVARRLEFSWAVAGLFGAAVALRLFYLWQTPWDQRTHDVEGHLWYLKTIAEQMIVPGAQACWVCYHPPLYYLLAGLVYKLFGIAGSEAGKLGVQIFSLVLNVGFVFFVLMTIKRFVFHPRTFFFLAAVLLFFPSLIVHSPRIGNDALFYFGFAGAFYFYVLWIQTKEGLYRMLFFAAVAFFAKMNGLLIMGILGLAFLVRITMLGTFKSSVKPIIVASIVFIVAIGSSMLVQHYRGGGDLVANSGGLNKQLFVGNKPINYLYFDYSTYLKEPFTDPWEDSKGRQYFWNFLLKTSLFGEFKYEGDVVQGVASAVSVLYLILIGGVLYGLLRLRMQELIRAVPFITAMFVLLAGALYLRMSIPAACSNDFRYIVPMVLPMSYFLGYGLEQLRLEGRFLYWIMGGILVLFSIMSALFVIFL